MSWLLNFKGLDASSTVPSDEFYVDVVTGLQTLYKQHVKEVEEAFHFGQFYSPPLKDGDFAAKPMVMIMGQYSTGKSTFIRHLMERDYPGIRIGPEPTTDKFVSIMHRSGCDANTGAGTDRSSQSGANGDRVVPGNAAVVDTSLPWTQLVEFGSHFLGRFDCVMSDAPVLRGLTFIDTPGVLSSGEHANRDYDFEGVIKWFADRVDMIILMFDAHKLDISEEFRRCIHTLSGNDSKIRILLNKADRTTAQELLRVYGALMWSLGKVVKTPEVAKVFIGSYWDKPLENKEYQKLFEAEARDLYNDIGQLPRNAAVRKLNDFIKRVRLVRAHALLISHIKKQLPYFNKATKQKYLVQDLAQQILEVSRDKGVPKGDFASVEALKKRLLKYDLSKLHRLDKCKLLSFSKLLEIEIPRLMKLLPQEERAVAASGPLHGTVIDTNVLSPFGSSSITGMQRHDYLSERPDTEVYREDFLRLCPSGEEGKIDGRTVRDAFLETGIPPVVLHRIWNLADVTGDGLLDLYEYSMARHFMAMKLAGHDLPEALPSVFTSSKAPSVASSGGVSSPPSIRRSASSALSKQLREVGLVSECTTQATTRSVTSYENTRFGAYEKIGAEVDATMGDLFDAEDGL